jgi:mono/diheme cytochrome c family protein
MNRSRVWVSGLCSVGLAVALVSTGAYAQDPPAAAPSQGTAAGGAKAEKVDAAALYKEKCAVCHAADGNSPLPHMSFADGVWLHGSSLKEVTNTITNGVPGTAMMSMKAQGLTDEEITALAKYVRHFDPKLKDDKGGSAAKTAKKPSSEQK